MSLEERVWKTEDIEHIVLDGTVVVDRTESDIPDCSIDELTKEEDYLRQNLTEIYNSGRAKMLIGMAGVLGIGKTTMSCHLQKWTQAMKYLERTDSPGLNLLYAQGGKKIFGFPYQFDVGKDRENMLRAAEGVPKSAVLDRTWQEDLLFAENFRDIGALTERQFDYVRRFVIEGVSNNKSLDIILSMEASNETLKERVKERNRKAEMVGVKNLSEEERRDMVLKKNDMIDYVGRYAGGEFDGYKSVQSSFEIPEQVQMEGAPPEYIASLNGVYKKRLVELISKEFRYRGVILKVNVDTKNGIDARINTYGQVPIMRALKEASILSLLRKGYKVVEKSGREGLEITPPWTAIH